MAQKKKKDYKRSSYVRCLDDVFSHYLRQKYADDNGDVKCYTCDAVMSWKELQCGHYYSRGSQATRWDEKDCRPQCYSCNVGKNGNYPVFAERLRDEIGDDGMDELKRLSHATSKFSRPDLLDLIHKYYGLMRWPGEISKTLTESLHKFKVI